MDDLLAGDGPNLAGSEAIDERGTDVGKVVDVIFDEQSRPTWAVVDLGLFRSSHYVPLAGAYRSADGRLVLAVDKDQVRHAPKAGRDHVLDHQTQRSLQEYWGIAS